MGCSGSKSASAVSKPAETDVNEVTKASNVPNQDEGIIEIEPMIGHVIKTKDKRNGEKMFINVLFHPKPRDILTKNATKTVDKKGETCWAFSAVIPEAHYLSCGSDSAVLHETTLSIIKRINSAYSMELDLDYVIPKMKRGFVGEDVGTYKFDLKELVVVGDTKTSPISIAPVASPEVIQHPVTTAAIESTNNNVESSEAVSTETPPSEPVSVIPTLVIPHVQHHHSHQNLTVTSDRPITPPVVVTKPPTPPLVEENHNTVVHTKEPEDQSVEVTQQNGSTETYDKTTPTIAVVDTTVTIKTEETQQKSTEITLATTISAPVNSNNTNLQPIKEVDTNNNNNDNNDDDIAPIKPLYVPPKMHGWLKKRGHIIQNWKTRYFVLDNGYLTYYVDKLDTPPYGKDVKGQLCLAGYREKALEGVNNEGGNSNSNSNNRTRSSTTEVSSIWQNRIHLVYDSQWEGHVENGVKEEYLDLLLEASSLEEKFAWVAAIQAHTQYTEASLLTSWLTDVTANDNGNNTIESRGDTPVNDTTTTGDETSTTNTNTNNTTTTHGNTLRSMSLAPSNGKKNPMAPTSRSVSIAAGGGRRKSAYSNLDDDKRWLVFLNPGEKLLKCGLTGKPNPMGIHLMRQLLLTSAQRLLYIDAKTLELKGEVNLNGKDVHIRKIDEITFEIVENKKPYKFITKDDLKADDWIAAMNE